MEAERIGELDMKHKIIYWDTELKAGDFIWWNNRWQEIYCIDEDMGLRIGMSWICRSKIQVDERQPMSTTAELCRRAHALLSTLTYDELVSYADRLNLDPIGPDGVDLRHVKRPSTLALLVAIKEQERHGDFSDFVAGPLRWPTEAGE